MSIANPRSGVDVGHATLVGSQIATGVFALLGLLEASGARETGWAAVQLPAEEEIKSRGVGLSTSYYPPPSIKGSTTNYSRFHRG